jgi:hypothetical protein
LAKVIALSFLDGMGLAEIMSIQEIIAQARPLILNTK